MPLGHSYNDRNALRAMNALTEGNECPALRAMNALGAMNALRALIQ